MNPFARQQKAQTPAVQWVGGGAFGRPAPTEWSLENAVVNGFRASSWVYTCATIHATHISKLPFKVWSPNSAGELRMIPGHDLELLVQSPNSVHTRRYQMQIRALHLLLGGNALDRVVRVGRGARREPVELWTLRPDSTSPVTSRERWISKWEVRGRDGGFPEEIPPEDVAHSMLPDPDNLYWGMPPLRAISQIVDMDRAQVEWNRELMANDASPAGVYVDPNIRDEKDRELVKETIKRKLSGPLRAREPLVLSGGAKWVQLGISPRELDWVTSRQFTIGEIAAAFWMLPARFSNDASTYNNLEQAVRYELVNGSLPLAATIGDGLALTLLTDEQRRSGMVIRPDTSKLEELKAGVHKSVETFERLIRSTIPPQTAAAIVDLPVGTLPHGDQSWKPVGLERVEDLELTEEDL